MANEWETKELPRAKGQIAPAQWNPNSVAWEPYEGVRKLEQKLNDIDNRLQEIENGNTTVNTQLTGRKVEKLTLFDAIAITDTQEKRVENIDISEYKKIDVLVFNSLDQDVDVRITDNSLGASRNIRFNKDSILDGNTFNDRMTVPNSSHVFPLSEYYSFLNHIIMQSIEVRLQCEVAPTSGSVTCILLGGEKLMPNETQEAVAWALQQTIKIDEEVFDVTKKPVIF